MCRSEEWGRAWGPSEREMGDGKMGMVWKGKETSFSGLGQIGNR